MLTKERVFELMKEAGLDEKKFRTLMEKEEAQLSPNELDEVTGAYFWQSSSSYHNFFKRAGVTWEHNFLSNDTFKWNGKTYNSRDSLLDDLKAAGIEPRERITYKDRGFAHSMITVKRISYD